MTRSDELNAEIRNQAAHPDIYAECSKKTVYKRFSVI